MVSMVAVVSLAILVFANVDLATTTPAVPDFSLYQKGQERRAVFFDYLQPLIDDHNQSVRRARTRVQIWYRKREDLSWFESLLVKDIASEYGISPFDVENESNWIILLKRVDIVPTSLALAQAAIETSWGTSRFAREANNYFGQWCFTKGCGLVPAKRNSGARHEVMSFNSPEEAVASYIHNLNIHPAYKRFREKRAQLRAADKPISGIVLANGLRHYSAHGKTYVKSLQRIIRQNNLSLYDSKDI